MQKCERGRGANGRREPMVLGKPGKARDIERIEISEPKSHDLAVKKDPLVGLTELQHFNVSNFNDRWHGTVMHKPEPEGLVNV